MPWLLGSFAVHPTYAGSKYGSNPTPLLMPVHILMGGRTLWKWIACFHLIGHISARKRGRMKSLCIRVFYPCSYLPYVSLPFERPPCLHLPWHLTHVTFGGVCCMVFGDASTSSYPVHLGKYVLIYIHARVEMSMSAWCPSYCSIE